MSHITDFITKYSWEDILITLFVIVDDICLLLYGASSRPRARGPQPDMADSEVITIAIFTDTFFQGNEELALTHIANYHRHLFPRLLTRSRFNRRRRALVTEIESVRRQITADLGVENDPYRLIDSLAIELCEYVRGSRCRSIPAEEPEERDKWFGVIPSKRKKKFVGPRLHFTTTLEGVVDMWLLAPGAIHDIVPTPELLATYRNVLVVGDKAYNDADLEADLRREQNVDLRPLRRKNQKAQWSEALAYALQKARRLIETAGSVLTGVFGINHPRARSWSGVVARIATKLLAYNMAFVLTYVLEFVFGN